MSKETISEILFELLKLDGNETSYLNKELYPYFYRLIVELAKVEKDVRWCSNEKCICHPEYNIKEILKNEDLVFFLSEYTENDVEKLLKWCETYKPIVAKGMYED